jgi:hypothetical protein
MKPHLNEKSGHGGAVYHLNYSGGICRRIVVPGQPGKKHETLLRKELKQKGQGTCLKW